MRPKKAMTEVKKVQMEAKNEKETDLGKCL
jgi:hypothetical protein